MADGPDPKPKGNPMLNAYNAPAIATEPTQYWWNTETYTAADGRVMRCRSRRNAIKRFYGDRAMEHYTQCSQTPQGTYRSTVVICDRHAFNRDGSFIEIGTVSHAIDYATYCAMTARY